MPHPAPSPMRLRVIALFAAACGACTGSIDGVTGPDTTGEPTTTTSSSPRPPGATTPGQPPGTTPGQPPGTTPGQPPPPPGARAVGKTPLRRLSRTEYVNTVRYAFTEAPPSIVPDDLPIDETVAGFTGQTHDLLTDAQLDQYGALAASIAQGLVAATDKVFGTCVRAEKGDAACLTETLARALPRLFRRPVPATELRALVDETFTPVAKDHGAEIGFEAIYQRVLLSPSFLFKIERGTPDPAVAGAARLGDHELAARLSYFLWRSPPDSELRRLADGGMLSDPATLRAQARRLLDDARSVPVVRAFHAEWLRLTGFDQIVKNKTLYMPWSDSLKKSMVDETHRLAEHVVRGVGVPWTDLLTARYSFVNPSLATLYGLPMPATMDFVRSDLPGEGSRAGLLGHASYLTAHSHAEDTQMIHRGLVVREQLLCHKMPPPDAVDTAAKVDRLTAPQCAGCHVMIEAIGVGFEAYDGIGRHRARPAKGKVTGLAAGEKEFTSVLELGTMLAAQPEVSACLARQWFRFALGREEDDTADAASLRAAAAALDGGAPVRALIEALVTADAFRYRREDPAGACQ